MQVVEKMLGFYLNAKLREGWLFFDIDTQTHTSLQRP